MLNFEESLEIRLKSFINSDSFLLRTPLCDIMAESGSDKCSDWHNYTPVYHFLFSETKNEIKTFFELGIYMGCSVRGWAKYLPNSAIFAGDVNSSYLINTPEIKSYLCDQDSKDSIKSMWTQIDKNFDIIIEDGKHEFESNLNFLLNSIDKLKHDGIFIIEDLTNSTKKRFEQILDQLKKNLCLSEIFILDIQNTINKIDNCLLIIRK